MRKPYSQINLILINIGGAGIHTRHIFYLLLNNIYTYIQGYIKYQPVGFYMCIYVKRSVFFFALNTFTSFMDTVYRLNRIRFVS